MVFSSNGISTLMFLQDPPSNGIQRHEITSKILLERCGRIGASCFLNFLLQFTHRSFDMAVLIYNDEGLPSLVINVCSSVNMKILQRM